MWQGWTPGQNPPFTATAARTLSNLWTSKTLGKDDHLALPRQGRSVSLTFLLYRKVSQALVGLVAEV